MKTYIGIKVINAVPCPARKDTANHKVGDAGYEVHYHPDGYKSWSPKEAFENAYHEIHEMTFGDAVYMMKREKKVQRRGWNGKGMFLYYVPANSYDACTPAGKSISANGKVKYGAYIAMKTVTGEVVPWFASQTDMLANDWQVVE